MDYARKTIFGHLQLYLEVINQQKHQTKSKVLEVVREVPKIVGNLQTDCTEILKETANPAEKVQVVKPTTANSQKETIVEEETEYFDPFDPLYGLN